MLPLIQSSRSLVATSFHLLEIQTIKVSVMPINKAKVISCLIQGLLVYLLGHWILFFQMFGAYAYLCWMTQLLC
jgi:hypothetical protein